MSKIIELRSLLKQHQISALILPNQDQFQNEYLPQHNRRIEFITGFTGSAATIIITASKAAFFTDGRYTLQAQEELKGNKFEIHNIQSCTPQQWLHNNNITHLWYDPYLHTEIELNKYNRITLHPTHQNLIDILWTDRPKFYQSAIKLHHKYAGESCTSKCKRLRQEEPFLITSPTSVCWLLNIRGTDVEHTPLLLSYAILYPDSKVDLFLYEKQEIEISDNVTQHRIEDLPKVLSSISTIALDPAYTPIKLLQLIHQNTLISRKQDPCVLAKSLKNPTEISGAEKAHIRDGTALTKFIDWLKDTPCTEKSAAAKLLALRKEQNLFQDISFTTISAFGKHGAIIHYTTCDDTAISKDNLYLLDSGGQYLDGTTDVTRTIAIGKPSEEQKYYYTLVLKGHIALARATFPVGTTGKQLDVLARQFLWQAGANYNHGTGHGVGSYLSVHEGPQSIPNDVPLQIGMILSNEPGFYKEGEYGIRIENLMHVVGKSKGYLCFKILTLVPIDLSPVNFNLMTQEEINWVQDYNSHVADTIKKQ